MSEEMKSKNKTSFILSALQGIVGPECATNSSAVMFPYSYDKADLSTPENPDKMPDWVVMPTTVKQIQQILALANSEKIPVTPSINGANMGGLTVPTKGGILMDLHKMNKVVEINEDDRYMVVEPGVTVGTVDYELRKRGLWVSMPYAPPAAASMLGNILLSGCGHAADWYGCQGDLLNCLEVVFPTGEVVRLGSAGLTKSWHSRYPVPDLTGLFMNWQGTTGIATKISFPIWTRPQFLRSYSYGFDSYEEAIWEMMVPWQRREMSIDIVGLTWEYTHVLVDKWPMKRPASDPLCFVYIVLAGQTEDEVQFRETKLFEFVNNQKKIGKLSSARVFPIPEEMNKFRTNMPTAKTFGFADHRNGGTATWVGSFTPVSGWVDGLNNINRIMTKYDFAASTVFGHIVKGSHHGMFRTVIPYNPTDQDEVEKVRQIKIELTANVVSHGGVAYKASPAMANVMLNSEYADPNFYEFMKKLKNFLDPNGIMNPGKWGL